MNVRMVFLVGMLLLEGSCSFDNMVSRNKSLESDATCRDSQLGSCQWYDGCLEASLDCGEMGYPLAYGKKYCEKFVQLEGSDYLMAWRDQTKRCLQEELLQAYDQGTHTCTDVQTAAFVSHPRCYTNHSHSICFAPVLEAATVVGLVDTEEFFKQESLRQMAATAGICINQIIARMGFFLQDEDETLDHKLIFWQDTKTRLEERLDPVITLR